MCGEVTGGGSMELSRLSGCESCRGPAGLGYKLIEEVRARNACWRFGREPGVLAIKGGQIWDILPPLWCILNQAQTWRLFTRAAVYTATTFKLEEYWREGNGSFGAGFCSTLQKRTLRGTIRSIVSIKQSKPKYSSFL